MNASSRFFGVYSTLVGSLPKPQELVDLQYAQVQGQTVDRGLLTDLTLRTMREAVRKQLERGIDVVVSGEADRVGFCLNILSAVTGFGGTSSRPWFPADLADHPDFAQTVYTPAMGRASAARLACMGALALRDPEAVHRELALYTQVLAELGVPLERAVWTEPAPGTIAASLDNLHYSSHREYVAALAAIMRTRYRAVVESGLLLQVDCPDLLMDRHVAWQQLPLEQFLEIATLNVAVLNEALEGIPPARLRAHSCYGNYIGTDTRDEPLAHLLAPLLKLRVGTLLLEGSVNRHREDYRVIRAALDRGDVPPSLHFGFGVIDTKHPSVEAPESIAEYIAAMRAALEERLVVAHPDCGFETMSGIHNLPETVVWEKVAQLAPGVRLANEEIAGDEGRTVAP
jgi:5-methyltetrahydropteroyltriglutamate--homocysteine methyltransferase